MNLAYVAGFFDGEGSVGFSRCRSSVYPRILIVNTNRDILEALRLKFGGDIGKLRARKINWKQGWYLRISWARAVNFLSAIEPWIRLKSDQIITVFAWNAIRLRGRRPNQEYRDAIQLLCARMRWLNQKGNPIGPDPIDQAIAMSKAGKSRKK